MRDEFRRKIREHRDAAKMVLQRAPAICLIELCAESFVLKHDVENIAQHFERYHSGFRDHRGGARVKIHAGHFAKKIAWAELRNRITVSEIDGSIDRNGSVSRFFLALIFFTRDERASQPLKETLRTALRFDVRDRSRNGNSSLAFKNVESRGSELAVAADNFAFAEPPLDDRPALQFQQRSRDALENRNLQEILGFESLRVRPGSDRRAHNAFVGERAGGAGNHTLAAGNTGGIAHRRIEIEGDARGIAFSHAAKHEIVFDFIAAADAAVAENTSVVVDGDGQGRIIFAARDRALCEARL